MKFPLDKNGVQLQEGDVVTFWSSNGLPSNKDKGSRMIDVVHFARDDQRVYFFCEDGTGCFPWRIPNATRIGHIDDAILKPRTDEDPFIEFELDVIKNLKQAYPMIQAHTMKGS